MTGQVSMTRKLLEIVEPVVITFTIYVVHVFAMLYNILRVGSVPDEVRALYAPSATVGDRSGVLECFFLREGNAHVSSRFPDAARPAKVIHAFDGGTPFVPLCRWFGPWLELVFLPVRIVAMLVCGRQTVFVRGGYRLATSASADYLRAAC
jgi:hypothetical protein